MNLRPCDQVEGKGEQGVAGEDRGRLVEGLVHGRPPAAQVVIIHGRQVVMHQRIAMQAFERSAGQQRPGRRGAEQGGAFNQQERAQPFAAAEHGMAHGGHQPRRAHDLAGLGGVAEQAVEQGLRFGGDGAEARGEIAGGTRVHVAF